MAMKEILLPAPLPWFDRSPERHLFFFMSGVGADVVPSWRQHLARSIFIVAECFREGHDIVVPGKLSVPHREHRAAARNAARRLPRHAQRDAERCARTAAETAARFAPAAGRILARRAGCTLFTASSR